MRSWSRLSVGAVVAFVCLTTGNNLYREVLITYLLSPSVQQAPSSIFVSQTNVRTVSRRFSIFKLNQAWLQLTARVYASQVWRGFSKQFKRYRLLCRRITRSGVYKHALRSLQNRCAGASEVYKSTFLPISATRHIDSSVAWCILRLRKVLGPILVHVISKIVKMH